MTLKSTVETIAHTALNTAVTAVRDPRGAAARATGLVMDTAGAGIGLVRSRIGGAAEEVPAPIKEASQDVVDKVEEVVTKLERPVPAEDPRDNIPGPDLAPFVPPAPEDLPEPIVIVAE